MQRTGKFIIVGAAALAISAGALFMGSARQRAVGAAPGATTPVALADAPTITVYKSPTCGCCKSWVEHLEKHGFKVSAHDVMDMGPIKDQFGVSTALESCHTAMVDGYVIEGHVPADVIARLLKERPQVAGLAVPGMPMGSPGMEGPYKERYDVIAFSRDGQTQVYESR